VGTCVGNAPDVAAEALGSQARPASRGRAPADRFDSGAIGGDHEALVEHREAGGERAEVRGARGRPLGADADELRVRVEQAPRELREAQVVADQTADATETRVGDARRLAAGSEALVLSGRREQMHLVVERDAARAVEELPTVGRQRPGRVALVVLERAERRAAHREAEFARELRDVLHRALALERLRLEIGLRPGERSRPHFGQDHERNTVRGRAPQAVGDDLAIVRDVAAANVELESCDAHGTGSSSGLAATEAARELYTRLGRRHDRGALSERSIDVLSAGEFLGDLGMALALLVLGRTLLSLLPPGAAGSHRPGELPLTLALSLVLGLVGVVAPALWLERCGIRRVWPLSVVWTIVPLLRWWLRPHGFVPRREWAERETPASKAALLAVCAMSAAPLAWALLEERDLRDALMRSAGLAAIAAFVLHGLGQARRAPLARRLVVLLFLATPVLQRHIDLTGLAAVAAAAMGASFLVAWLRRGDERAGVLSAIGFAILALFTNAAWIAGIAVLVIASHSNARRRVLVASALAVLMIGAGIRGFGEGPHGFLLLDDASPGAMSDAEVLGDTTLLRAIAQWQLWGATWITLGLSLTALALGVRGAQHAAAPDRPGRELVALVVVVIATLGLHVVAHAFDPRHPGERALGAGQELALLLPAAALIIGLVLAPSEIGSKSR